MTSKENGLTVGELTIAIGVLLIIAFAWTTFSKKNSQKEISFLLPKFETSQVFTL